MAKNKFSYKFLYDAPVTVTVALLTLTLFIIDSFFIKTPVIATFLSSPTSSSGASAFSFSSVKCILSLFFHIFSYFDLNLLLCDVVFILLLGPFMEERYGSLIIGIMIFVASLFSGVLNACFCKEVASGAGSIVFMLILLNVLVSVSKKTVSLSSVFALLVFIFRLFFLKTANGIFDVIIIAAGGLAGSLFTFIASPKARKTRKEAKGGLLHKAEKVNKKSAASSSDETIEVGTLKF